MPTCGNCKATGQTIEHIKGCFAQKNVTTAEPVVVTGWATKYVESRDFKPMALDIPDSRYALIREDGPAFYELRTGTKGQWKGFQFLERLIGAPGDWKRTPIKGQAKKNILAEIGADPKAAAVAYGTLHNSCAVCHSPLTDPDSLAAGIGPICAKRF